MFIKEVCLIGIALAMDALGITISLGLNSKVKRKNKILFIISFGLFQFIFALIGGVQGRIFNTYIISIPNFIGGVILFIVGFIMLIDGLKKDDSDDKNLISRSMYIVLGASVSIDALVVGFTNFCRLRFIVISLNSMLMGLITLLICTLGFYFCKYIRKIKIIEKYSDLLGGGILIILAIRMMFLGV
ncbi:manganese efflux pump [Clostridium sp.]|uniref:manganese efflux pump MntP n=1 Tax=Clostridium sp. TaxID=1506 RepID=UPI00261393B3|nr:manganese efflux pump [Clostridium sp.]